MKKYIFEYVLWKYDQYLTLQDGLPPLHIACWQGHVDVTEILLKCGAQIDIQAKVILTIVLYVIVFVEGVFYPQSGHSALWHSSFRGNAELIKLLIEHGAQVDLQTNV